MDDWSLSELAAVAASDRASNQPGPVTAPLTAARSFMDDFHASSRAVTLAGTLPAVATTREEARAYRESALLLVSSYGEW
jgi:hypothetical protein